MTEHSFDPVNLKDAVKQSGLSRLQIIRLAKENKISLYFGYAADDLENQKIEFTYSITDKNGKECLEVKRFVNTVNGRVYRPLAIPIYRIQSKELAKYIWLSRDDIALLKELFKGESDSTGQQSGDVGSEEIEDEGNKYTTASVDVTAKVKSAYDSLLAKNEKISSRKLSEETGYIYGKENKVSHTTCNKLLPQIEDVESTRENY